MNQPAYTDGHFHYSPQTDMDFLARFLTRTETESAVIQAVSHSQCVSLIPGALTMKAKYPKRFFVFGSPDLSAYYFSGEDLGKNLADYARRMIAAGCDGIKMLEGKPQMRKAYPIPDFDDPCWEAYWQYLEESGTPVTWHVNDPESFWNKDASEWLKKQGWVYDESYVNNEDQYRQVMTVLERHPGLRIIFAHFFFLSAKKDRLDDILDRYPNVMTDLTPGIEMYENFSADIAGTKAFFEKHHGRIVYGTDIGGRCILTNEGEPFNEKENLRRPVIVRDFLTGTKEQEVASDGNFLIQRKPFVMKPLSLSGERLQEICSGNIRRQIGHDPYPVDADAVLEECTRWREKIGKMTKKLPGFMPDLSQIVLSETFFNKN